MYHAKAKLAGSVQCNEIKINFADEVEWNGKTYKKDTLSFQSPVTGAIYGTLFNFQEQYDAMEAEFNQDPYKKPPEKPILYIKPRNTINSHQQPIQVPHDEDVVQINATLGIVMGRNAVKVNEAEAVNYIDGYTIVNDVSIPHETFYRPDIKYKVRDGFCSIGPWIVARKEVPHPEELMIRTFRNGDLIQTSHTKDLVRSIPRLITEVTEFMTLAKGDMLLVGVPNDAPIASPGDTIKIDIEQIGSLENSIIRESIITAGGGM